MQAAVPALVVCRGAMAGARVGTPRAHRAAQSSHVDYVPYYVSLSALSLCSLLWVLTPDCERSYVCFVLSFCVRDSLVYVRASVCPSEL